MILRRDILLKWIGGLLILQSTIIFSGCANALLLPIYLFKGTDKDPEYKEIVKDLPKEAKIVVVCRTGASLFGNDDPSPALSYCIMHLLSEKLPEKKKFEFITYDKVMSSFEEEEIRHSTFTKIAKKVKADYILGVDIDSYSTHISSQLFQGKAIVHVQFIETKTGKILARKTLPQYTYPPTATPLNNRQPSEFEKQYIGKLAHQIGRLFYAYNPHEDIAVDSDFKER